jgi:integrase
MPPRNVNKHRALLHAIFAYATREDTHGLAANPVSGTDTRYEPPAPPLDHYEVDEVEALARVCEQGGHRGARHYRGRSVEENEAELAARAAEDQQDAACFRVLFFSGLCLGEALAPRWRHVLFLLTGAVLDVRRAVSAGIEKEPKSRRPRQVPLPRPAAEAFARLGKRHEFTSPDDYVFCNRLGYKPVVACLRNAEGRDEFGDAQVSLQRGLLILERA